MKTQRVNSHLVPEDGSITCTDVGLCKFLGQIKKYASIIILYKTAFYFDVYKKTVVH